MYGLNETLTHEILALAEKHGLSSVVLFGSRARGDYGARSDIDLAVSGGDCARFALDVEEETSTLLFFDLVDLGSPIQPELRENIQRDGVVLYAKA